MKKSIKKITKLVTLFSLLLLSCCEKENVETTNQKNANAVTFKNVSLRDLAKTNPKLLESVNDIKKSISNPQSKVAHDSLYDFYINQNIGIDIETSNYQSYTFPIYRKNNDGKIENILFSLENNGEYAAYIVKYEFTTEQLNSTTLSQITENDLTITPINDTARSSIVCIETWTSNPLYNQCNQTHSNGEHCDSVGAFIVTSTCTMIGSSGYQNGGSQISLGNGGAGDIGNNGTGMGSGGVSTTPIGGYTSPQLNFIQSLFDSNELTAENFLAFSTETQNAIFNYAQTSTAYQISTLKYYLINSNSYWISEQTTQTQTDIFNYLIANNFSSQSTQFINQLIDLAIIEPNQADINSLINISLIVEKGNYTVNSIDSNFLAQIDPYVDLDLSNNDIHNPIITHLIVKYHILKAVNPTWSKNKLVWETVKDILHTGLDVFGLFPIFGEPADLINGVIYTLEGDNLNASLSYASTIPVWGWVSSSTKFGLKIVNTASTIATKVKLTWKVLPNGNLFFGSDNYCRAQLRKVLGLAVGNPLIAHHIMPISLQSNEVIQRAAKSSSAFHLNEALNGIPLNSLQHTGNHANYSDIIELKLNDYLDLNPNATPMQCYNYLVSLINDIKAWILAHPNTNINLIVLP